MIFKVDKHNRERLCQTVFDIHDRLKSHPFFDRAGDWEIYGLTVNALSRPGRSSPKKVSLHKKSIERGDIVPPVVLAEDKRVIDGEHRLNAFLDLNYQEVPVAIPRGDGSGERVFDEIYKSLIEDVQGKKDWSKTPQREVECLNCGKVMKKKKEYLNCECGQKTFYENLIGWTVTNV